MLSECVVQAGAAALEQGRRLASTAGARLVRSIPDIELPSSNLAGAVIATAGKAKVACCGVAVCLSLHS